MKVFKLTSFLLLFFCFNSYSQFFSYETDNKKSFVYYNNHVNNSWEAFHESVFTVPKLLDQANRLKTPVIMVIPEYDGLTPVCTEAPGTEGARVALAWASSYFRFNELGNTDIKIIKYPKNKFLPEDTLLEILKKLPELPEKRNKKNTPEQAIQGRIICLEQLSHKSENKAVTKALLEPLVLPNLQEPTIIITPALEDKKEHTKRILVTGGAGFIGSFLTKKLLDLGHQVIVLDNFFCCDGSNLQDIDNKNLVVINHDVTKKFTVEGPLDIVMHLASLPSPAFYYTKPRETLEAGLLGTKNTLDLALEKNARYLFASTSEVYGDPVISPQPEEYPGNVSAIGKRSQYDESKRGGETLIKLYFEKYAIDVRIMRIFNTYGPGMCLNDGRVVTNFIEQALKAKPLTMYGDGLQTRSFAYVSDTVDGIMKILFSDTITNYTTIQERIFNVGNPGEFTIRELAEKIKFLSQKYLNRETNVIYCEQPDQTDPKQRCPDITKINKETGYQPAVSLDEGLEKTFLHFLNLSNKTT